MQLHWPVHRLMGSSRFFPLKDEGGVAWSNVSPPLNYFNNITFMKSNVMQSYDGVTSSVKQSYNSNNIHQLIHQSGSKVWRCTACHGFMCIFLPDSACELHHSHGMITDIVLVLLKGIVGIFLVCVCFSCSSKKLTSKGAEWGPIRSGEATSQSTSQKVGQSGAG